MAITCSIKRLVAVSLLAGQCGAAQWLQVGGDIDGENPRDYAGGSKKALAMSADATTLAVGASGHDGAGDGAGHVRVFDLVAGAWSARGTDLRGEHAGDRFGASVVLSADGNVVGIGAPDSEAGHTGRFEKAFGQVRIFEWLDKAWTQRGPAIGGVAKYDHASGHGGLAMDAAGTTVVVGAADHGDGPAGDGAGHVRVFDWEESAQLWVQRGGDLHGDAPGDWFGYAVATSAAGDAVAVGALFDDGDEEAGAFGCVVCRGSVRVYDWVEGVREWRQRGRDLDGARDDDKSGSALALNAAGTVVAIGSPRSSASFDAAPGSVVLYAWNGTSWRQRGDRVEGEEVGDLFGATLALSAAGDTLAVGAYLNDGGSELEGRVRVLDYADDAWVQRGGDLDGENRWDNSGYSLAMSADGDVVASGARYTDDAGESAGHARVFAWTADASTADASTADACGDARFAESDDGTRHRRKISRFRQSEVATVGACSQKCVETPKCRGITWNPSKKKPCTTLKGRKKKPCRGDTCCSLL